MLIFRGIPDRADTSTVLTIGNFDGVHRGHQALLARLVDHARDAGLPSAVMTFEPHPREFFDPVSAPTRLTSLREKLTLLERAGVDRTYICRFDARLARVSAQAFIDDILARGLGVRHVIVGDDFRFGAKRGGDFEMLRAAGQSHRFRVEAMHTVDFEGERVSSSAIRDALAEGDLAHAARLLGRPYSIAGRVVEGRKLGRSLGYPTANVQLKRNRPPFAGVFAVRVAGIGRALREGVANLGTRPTVDGASRPALEVHLFDFESDLYCAHVEVIFQVKLRDEMKFPGLAALTEQIGRDAGQAREWLRAHPATA